ncbi:hypothetical protein HDU96_010814 [Phlyctochytrium bullatum]|nr:hypothetical protein HDU96_010814 [Phlyctochytrium bullatum]
MAPAAAAAATTTAQRTAGSLLSILLLLSALVATPSRAHYVLTVPATRGFIDADEPKAPCGGFNTPVNPVAFAAVDATVEIALTHSTGRMTINLRPSSTANNSNDNTANSSAWVTLGSFNVTNPMPSVCAPPPFMNTFKVSVPQGFKDGDRAVLQTVFDGPDGVLYQCADVVIGSPAEALPPRTDTGLSTITPENSQPVDPCSLGVEDFASRCPNVKCPTASVLLSSTSAMPFSKSLTTSAASLISSSTTTTTTTAAAAAAGSITSTTSRSDAGRGARMGFGVNVAVVVVVVTVGTVLGAGRMWLV